MSVMPGDPPAQCLFCRIIRKEEPAEILYETPGVIALLDIHPIHFGHTLIIPRTHSTDLLSVPGDELSDIMNTTQLVARALVDALGLKGFNIFSNNGRIAGQSVFHFHMHITPRHADDNIRFVLHLKEYPLGELRQTAESIRRSIAAFE